jgi:hypothetical protein
VDGFVVDIFIFPLETRNLIKEVLNFLLFNIKSNFWLIQTNYCLNYKYKYIKKKVFNFLLHNNLEYILLNLETNKNFKLKDVNENLIKETFIISSIS